MTMCTISKCTFVNIGPFCHDKVNVLQGWPLFLLRLLKTSLHGGGQAACFRLSPTPSDVLRWVVSERLPTRPFALSVWAGSIHSRRLTPGAVGCTPHLSAAQRNDVSMDLFALAHQHCQVGSGRTVWCRGHGSKSCSWAGTAGRLPS